ncbi:MAG: sigma-70 family RNA polymerase sigma factor [Phycisphaeraceae bacterium]|nr:sigma-70 family RNA polymerase sigma factor [Phycisphaeraceae bacterium]
MATEQPDEHVLIDRAVEGDRQAFGALAQMYAAPLYTFLVRRSGSRDHAEDLAQSALLRAWLKLPTYRPSRSGFLPWLLAVANSVVMNEHRRRRIPLGALSREPSRIDPDPLAHAEACVELWSLVDRVLSPQAATAVWLRYGENLEIRDIARVFAWTGARVRITLFRARGALARAMHAEESVVGIAPTHGDRAHAL